MTINEVADLLFAARERIDFYWNFYVVVIVAVIGWLVSLKRPLERSMRVLVSLAYMIASSLNLLGLYSSYTFAEALRTDMLRLADSTTLTNTRLFLEQHSYLPQQLAAIITHLVVGAAILFVVWFARFSESDVAAARLAPRNAETDDSHQKRARR